MAAGYAGQRPRLKPNRVARADVAVICEHCRATTVIPLDREDARKALDRDANCLCGKRLWLGPEHGGDHTKRLLILQLYDARTNPPIVDTVRLRVPCDETGRRATGSAPSRQPAN